MKIRLFEKIKYERDWQIIVLAFGLGLIIVSAFAWQIYLSNKIGGGYFESDDVSSGVVVRMIDQKRLENSVSILKQKEIDFENEAGTRTNLVDPSL
jgi:hypothetical protein